jgi:hypothetical protein
MYQALILIGLLTQPLQGNVSINVGKPPKVKLIAQKPKYDHRKPILETEVSMHISAIGLSHDPFTGKINRIDPASDLYNKVYPGDILVSIANESPAQSLNTLSNFGNENTIVTVIVLHKGERKTFACHRKPLENFQPSIQEGLKRRLRP